MEKAWEAQRDAIYQEHKQLKGRHEYQKKWCEGFIGKRKFKEHAWKQYQKQHPAKAEQYQNLYKTIGLSKPVWMRSKQNNK